MTAMIMTMVEGVVNPAGRRRYPFIIRRTFCSTSDAKRWLETGEKYDAYETAVMLSMAMSDNWIAIDDWPQFSTVAENKEAKR